MTKPSTPSISAATHAWALLTTALALLPLLLQLPSSLALIFAVTAIAVAGLARRTPVPGPLRLLLVIALLGTIYWQMGANPGRDSGCALLAAMLAIKSSELRTLRDARSLIGFALFAPFASFLLDQGPITLLLALAAVVSALLALQRLADEEGHAATPARLVQLRSIARLVMIALPLTLISFWLFPRLASPLWGIPERSIARPGISDTMTPGEWIDLMGDDSPALRAQFFGETPPPQQRYWRGPVLTRFDGRRWSRIDPVTYTLPATAAATTRWDYQIEYEPTDRRQLVALDLPLSAPNGAQLSADYSLVSERNLTALSRWRLQSSAPQQFQSELPPQLRQQTLQLPSGFNPRTRALAQQWRQQAGDDDNAIVQQALSWITREFAYTLTTPLPGRHGVDEFLFQYKAGFCEHFSAAFVVLMRNADIPARVVTGYTGGVRNRYGNYLVVRRMDAHAWAEVWLPERGWVRVDPTAAVAPERIYDTLEDRLGNSGGDAGMDLGERWRQLAELGDFLRRNWNGMVLSFDANRQQQLLRPFGIQRLEPSQLIAIFAVFAALALGWMAWLLARGEREHDPLLRAWQRLGQRYARLGLAPAPHEAAITWARRVEQTRPDEGLSALSQRFADARYAGNDPADVSLLRDLYRHRPKPGAQP